MQRELIIGLLAITAVLVLGALVEAWRTRQAKKEAEYWNELLDHREKRRAGKDQAKVISLR
jgi:hypothetical protein